MVWRWSARGTQRGELLGLPPTGREVTLTGISIDRLAGGQIVERWGELDKPGPAAAARRAPGAGAGRRVGAPQAQEGRVKQERRDILCQLWQTKTQPSLVASTR